MAPGTGNSARQMFDKDDPFSLDTLIRADIDRRADGIDPRGLFERIRATNAGASDIPKTLRLPVGRRIIRWASGISAAAAAVLIAILLGTHGATPAQASPRELLLEARKQFSAPVDRCYLVEMRKDSPMLQQEEMRATSSPSATQPSRNVLLQQSRMTLLWTRGDQFWMTPINAGQPFAWGRGKAGDYWIALGQRRGVQYDPAEPIPPFISHTSDIMSMRLDVLLDDVLGDNFELTRLPPTDQQLPTTVSIRATLKKTRFHPLKAARIEFDEQTKVVRKLVLEREPPGVPPVTLTYLLVDTEPRDDRSYELAGHLEADYELFDSKNQPARRGLLMRFFGPGMMDNPMRPMNPNQPPTGPRGFGPRPLPPATQPSSREGL